jgi:hypothetical protein
MDHEISLNMAKSVRVKFLIKTTAIIMIFFSSKVYNRKMNSSDFIPYAMSASIKLIQERAVITLWRGQRLKLLKSSL